ncbi:hypothetical protein FEFB_05670 [Fructobacillus sp. EFB-N1]|uniref:DUF6710 family protein n=1 Tax=Fructobacillus sp. EFB-N1 TaxID=1658766 RepID=UPI00065D2144|nr:DUF6710 family protein [Fructobacillus sp. EFB-N1]KMK53632.1 hypothetical protein FEFB_05670 [Fructobacillus sp. EFB-N1]
MDEIELLLAVFPLYKSLDLLSIDTSNSNSVSSWLVVGMEFFVFLFYKKIGSHTAEDIVELHKKNLEHILDDHAYYKKRTLKEKQKAVQLYLTEVTALLTSRQFAITVADANHTFKKESLSVINYDDFFKIFNKASRRLTVSDKLVISDWPLLQCIWNNNRLIDNLISFSRNESSFDIHNENISNQFVYPLGITLVNSGNHSQFVNFLQGNREYLVSEIVDLTDVLNHWHFNGKHLVNSSGKVDRSLEKRLGKGQTVDDLFYAGVLFELGKILMKHNELFPQQILDLIKNRNGI